MKNVFFLLIMLTALKSFSQDTIPTSRAKEFIGKEVWVRGTVASVKQATAENNVAYINVDKSFPDNVFTVVINTKYAQRLKLNLAAAKGKKILVKGKITVEKNNGQTPQIFNPTQIQIK
ncbi:MAG: hypothetical protein CFE23_06660 [Flavobacterium sp. BFFFF1]|uniref:exodeoxyribonuclease VII large subunit n=1 Tax=unclassified Flavobacterium TaxID=196869 RepID=UPI000BD0C273|nr:MULTISPECIES: exodeoxyribonuclease VII large subunit [unclassified Flavobacterium]OYU80910.1 MAG: hypothetical protein CFE23_06660 [Flavobacterium sp. BFFFF1]